jgi:hypothetical protein
MHSQPSVMSLFASPKPRSQEMPQTAPSQVGMENAYVAHNAPQALQLNGSRWRSAQ